MRVAKSFVINAEAIRAYDIARDFFLKLGYAEQNAIRPTLLVLKRRGIIDLASSINQDYRISLRASFNPVGNLQLYSTPLVAIRCEYDVKAFGAMDPPSDRSLFESEIERLRTHLTKLLHLPTISPSTANLRATNPSEQCIRILEEYEQADVHAKLIQHEDEIHIGETINLEIHIENNCKKAFLLTKVEKLVPDGFQLISKPASSKFEETHLIMKEKRLAPCGNLEIGVVFKPLRKGIFEIKPKIIFLDDNRHEMITTLEPKTYNVLARVFPGRISTGYEDLDNLLFGGIPENYSVLMTSPSNDERELIIKKFLVAGVEAGQITFHIAVEPGNGKILAEKFQSNFYLFVCNPRADLMISSLPNVFKLSGVENLSEISIALAKSFRLLDASQSNPRRACIEIISDVLLQQHAVITRKWLSRLLPELKSKGFTTLGVVNPHMHSREEVQAILGLFEGEIKISEKETEKGIEKVLRIVKLYNQRYLENELTLKKERMDP